MIDIKSGLFTFNWVFTSLFAGCFNFTPISPGTFLVENRQIVLRQITSNAVRSKS